MSDMICVWEFRSVDGKQEVTSVRPAEVDDYKYEHHYQRIIYRGPRHDWDKRKA